MKENNLIKYKNKTDNKMSSLAKEYKNLKNELFKDYYNSLNELEKQRYLELNACLKIQKNARKRICERRSRLLKEICLEIQRHFRGFLARDLLEKNVQDLSNEMNAQFFDYHAIIIQKHWQGYKCRRNKLDYHERRKYLQMIKHRNEETLIKLQEYSRCVQYELERQNELESRKEFNKIANNLHHLVSTSTIPGVYNNPNLPEELKPQVYNADVETHLKAIFKNNFRKSLIKK